MTRVPRFGRVALAFLLATGAACGDAPASAPELGALGHPAVVTARDGGVSAAIKSKMLWLFSDTLMTVTGSVGVGAGAGRQGGP